MPRLLLNDELWSKLSLILMQFSIHNKPNLRRAVEGMLFRMRTGQPWRDLPEYFGSWNSVYKKFNNWSKKGIWTCVFQALVIAPDYEFIAIDGSYIKAHQHSAGAQGYEDQAIGKSRAGNTTKIHMVVDTHGLPIHFMITGGNINDSVVALELIEPFDAYEYLLADKGYDKEELREEVKAKGATPVVPRKSNSTIGNDDLDEEMYKYRHLVENIFARLKHFRAIATRYDKLSINYESVVAMGCMLLWLPM